MNKTQTLLSGQRKFKWVMKASRTRRVNDKQRHETLKENDKILRSHNIFNLKNLPKQKSWDPYHALRKKKGFKIESAK